MKNNLQRLINTDSAFSESSVKNGTIKAFSQYLIKNAIMLPQNKTPIFSIKEICFSMSKSNSNTV